jgi:hypothetical protein
VIKESFCSIVLELVGEICFLNEVEKNWTSPFLSILNFLPGINGVSFLMLILLYDLLLALLVQTLEFSNACYTFTVKEFFSIVAQVDELSSVLVYEVLLI